MQITAMVLTYHVKDWICDEHAW